MNSNCLVNAIILAMLSIGLSACSVPAKVRFANAAASRPVPLAQSMERVLSETDPGISGKHLAEFVSAWFKQRERATYGVITDGAGRNFEIRFASPHRSSQLPEYFDQITAAHLVKIGKIQRYTRRGVGGRSSLSGKIWAESLSKLFIHLRRSPVP